MFESMRINLGDGLNLAISSYKDDDYSAVHVDVLRGNHTSLGSARLTNEEIVQLFEMLDGMMD